MEVVNKAKVEELVSGGGVVVLDFFATWCGPCKLLTPVLEELDAEMADVSFVKIDIDEERELAAQYEIMSVPTVLFVKGGEVVDKLIGFKPKQVIVEKLNGIVG